MKVCITGHRNGLGRELFINKRFDKTIGFDLLDGFDINNPDTILPYLSDVNVFINNAYHPVGQELMFKAVDDLWQSKSKLIVNISSMAAVKKDTPYANDKRRLEEASKAAKCRVTTIRPGLLDTPLTKSITGRYKMDARIVADIIACVINSPIHIPLIEIEDVLC
jgi:NAD(P)-dependent dehydrogenase (short-subunit alcohol dehydrogenase family)